MKPEYIYEIWDRFEASNLAELELEFQGTRIRLVRQEKKVVSQNLKPIDNEAESSEELVADEKFLGIKAPLAGTFYIASSPENDPFITVGQKVKKGDVVGIIEAMKLMNEVKADREGRVTQIMAQDGHLVEYGQPLVRIEYV